MERLKKLVKTIKKKIETLIQISVYSNLANRTLWTLSGDQGNTWKNGQAPVASGIPYNVCVL
jgi:hypothetical protein